MPVNNILESVFAVLKWESDSFNLNQGQRTALISCMVVCGTRIHCACTYHTRYSGVGYCIVYLIPGFAKAPILVNETNSTLSFF